MQDKILFCSIIVLILWTERQVCILPMEGSAASSPQSSSFVQSLGTLSVVACEK